jgi:hypothetical protein
MTPRSSDRRLALLLVLVLAACSGGEGDPGSVIDADGNVEPWAMGVADPEAKLALLELTGLGPAQTLAAVPSEELLAAREAVLALGVGSVPAIGQQLRNGGGCLGPHAAELLGLLGALTREVGFETSKAVAVGDLVLEMAVTGPAPPAPERAGFDAFLSAPSDDPASALTARGAELLAGQQPRREAWGQQACVARSLDLLRSLHDREKIGSGNLLLLVEKYLARLPDADPRSIELLLLYEAAAPQDRQTADRMEDMTLDARLHDEARAVACTGALWRRSRVEKVAAAFDQQPGPVIRCVMREGQGTDWWTLDFPRKGLTHADLEVRLTAIESIRLLADDGDFELLRKRLEIPELPMPAHRERSALIRAAVEILQLRAEITDRALDSVNDAALRAILAERLDGAEDQRPVEPRRVEAWCDEVVPPEAGAEGLRVALERLGPGASICGAAGSYEGDLELAVSGARLLTLAPGATTLTGRLVVREPAVALGWTVGGSLLVGPGADGSALLALRVAGDALVESGASLFVDVEMEGVLHGPWTGFETDASIPPSPSALVVQPGAALVAEHGHRGGATGWVDTAQLEPLSGVDLWPSGQRQAARLELRATKPWDALAGGLALMGPDRFQAPPKERWAALYGTGQAVDPVLAIPLSPAPWQAVGADLLLGLQAVAR